MKILIALVFVFGVALGAPVTSVPGFPDDLPFKADAGYLSADDGDKQMFYFFAESQNDPATDPVVLWLNGGPGCSSFDGFIYENGPFFFNDGPMGADQNLTLNPNSWNKVANMIWLDSPCGVGLSYSNNPDVDYVTNDTVTAYDSHNFLLNFFKTFPQFAKNDFYISGESYAGIYIPTLAQQVVLGNSNPNTYINLVGILVGNGVTDEVFDGNAWIPFIWGHSFISNPLYNSILETCQGNYWNSSSNDCNNLLNNASNDASPNNIYNVYLPCYNGPDAERAIKEKALASSKMSDLEWRYTSRRRETATPGDVPPCIDADRATAYMNVQAVRDAFNAVSVSDVTWEICAELDYTSVYSTVIPIHKFLLKSGIRILIYSGDADMCVPHTGSESWTESLGLPVSDEWRPWFVDNQVAGYVRGYEGGLTFATIKGAGHMVPQYRPPQALYFFTQFLNSQPF